ncbi:glycoside hydrolase family 3 protein [Paenibacillus sp. J5C_2022]|uniref:glycoside hydrolase family 3 protein n=1 Tax=Paenibacillus sp. J5C2022 TaxID=2977129 RepID=UPI0021CEACB5|nr:glycoside hydrolase family 3 N-terminal domain-containing protein [Paenibacillus sp. J5C2022]MCU6707754.1 glycoside hydrolase family 3 protein [Paenibacillus sp. J5C2022]
MMVDLAVKPFYLNEEEMRWVHDTLNAMDVREKVGQLFCPIGLTDDREQLGAIVKGIKPGGMMFRPGPGEQVQDVHRYLQEQSRIPLLLAANLEAGGNGIATDGTYFGKPLQVAATNREETAYRLGLVAGREGRAVGCNWSFAPVVDIDVNCYNPITNVRTFGSDPSKVAAMAKAYAKGLRESGLAAAVKHFPGDGVDERDQHLLSSVNSLSVEQWEETFGEVYRELIEAGAGSVMVGHIMLPAYSRKLVPGIADDELMPATLAPELIRQLLRGQLGFNGLVVTDATAMAGFMMAEKREIAVPKAIASGCDMFLFNKNIEEDFAFMMQGIASGILTLERVDEAVLRILALKASLGLHRQQREGTLVPEREALTMLQHEEHVAWAKACAEQSVTLVQDKLRLLPLAVETHKRVLLYVLGDRGGHRSAPIGHYMIGRLREEGFEVSVFDRENVDFASLFGSVKAFREQYDWVLYLANVETASNQTTVRIQWEPFMAADVPWFVREVPTVFVSVANPYHLFDVPQIGTYINAYSGNEMTIDAVIGKLLGGSAFKGVSPVDPFSGAWEVKA